MTQLIFLHEGKAIPYSVSPGDTVIGRHPDCDIQLQSNTISRRHARISGDSSQFYVEDLGSGNGTFVNGQKVDVRTAINNQDRVKFGPLLLRFECEAVQSAPAPSMPAPVPSSAPDEFDDFGSTIEFSADSEDEAMIMGNVGSGGGFGMLAVAPEQKLKAVIEITRALTGETDMDAMLPKILDTLFEVFPQADRSCILLKDPEKGGEMIPRAYKHRRDDEDATVKLSRTILKKVLTDKSGILSADAANDTQFDAAESISNLSIRSMMCVPMLDKSGEPIGVINIDTQNPLSQFGPEDLEILMTVAGQASLTYDNARLMKSWLEKQKQDGEMAIAMNVQRALLPESFPQQGGYSFYASYDSAQAVGGDYYDAFRLTDDLICLSFGDVAGKGVPGALIMSRIASCVQTITPFIHDPVDAIVKINEHMCANMVEGRFVTYILIVLDVKNHKMRMVNAGHMSPFIRKPDGTVDNFDEELTGLPVGVMEGYPYEVTERDVHPGEMFVLFTDGVDEAMNPESELYTLERMRDFVKNGSDNAETMGKELLADVRRHANGRPQNDDITIMTFSRDA
jgi:sigma-B regulation protein RsbU (phosphoserine phosphatase)